MHSDSNKGTEEWNENRRKRINRMKKLIIICVLLFILLPTICCIVLGLQVNRLQKQVNELSQLYGINTQSQSQKDGLYAYAAVKDNTDTIILPSITPSVGNGKSAGGLENNIPTDGILGDDAGNNDASDKNADHLAGADDNKDKTATEIMPTNAVQTDTDAAQTGTVQTDADKAAAAQQEAEAENKAGIYKGEKVYLTFDDGPSIYTDDILDILAKYQVKATFFVVGKTDKKSKEIYKRIVDEGHTLGMHSYSHKYSTIYKSVEDFDKDFTKLWELLYDTTGYKPTIYRFPGGSDNLVNENGMDMFIKYLNEKSIVYFDWNVVNGDATGKKYTKKQLVNNVLQGVAGKKRAIVLMHDAASKKLTVDSLPKLLEALIAGGAELLPLDENVEPIQMIKADGVK